LRGLVRRSGLSVAWARRPQPDQAGAAGATDDGAGSASHVKPSNAQPDVSWRRWTSRPKACVDRLQHQQHGLKRRSA
jgi:hypothetical protein